MSKVYRLYAGSVYHSKKDCEGLEMNSDKEPNELDEGVAIAWDIDPCSFCVGTHAQRDK